MQKLGTLVALLAALLLNGLTLTSPHPASADDGDLTFETGGGKVAAIDLTGLHVGNGRHRVVMVLHVRDLTEAGRFHFFMVEASPEPRYGLEAEVFKRDGEVVDRFREFDDGQSHARPCAGSTARWAKGRDLIRLSFPQRCFRAELPGSWKFATASRLHFTIDDRSEVDNPRKTIRLARG